MLKTGFLFNYCDGQVSRAQPEIEQSVCKDKVHNQGRRLTDGDVRYIYSFIFLFYLNKCLQAPSMPPRALTGAGAVPGLAGGDWIACSSGLGCRSSGGGLGETHTRQ